jgi:DNA/RNA-binding domain of Phe-tRNA-synthetase-like protein
MLIDISEIAPHFPEFRVAAVLVDDLEIDGERPAELGALLAEREAACRQRWGKTELSEIPGIAVWRKAYRAFGIKRTSYRSSVERLVKNVLAGRPIPEINAFVDAYNAASLAALMPLGADDLDKISGDLFFRYSRVGDQFIDMAGAEEAEASTGASSDPPKEGEVVYADSEKVLCRRWNWRQDIRSLVTPETRHAVVTVQFNGVGDLDAAVADLRALIGRFTGGETLVTIADRRDPVIEIETG